MTKSLVESLTQTVEGNRLYQQEKAILDATELICKLMTEQKVSRFALAKRLKTVPGSIGRILDGRDELTIRLFSDILVALGYNIRFEADKRETDGY